MERYRTIAAPVAADFVVQRSRFCAVLLPAADTGAAQAGVRAASALHPQASHCCWACRVGYPDRPAQQASDAGEPGGTAGRPMLAALTRAELWNVAVVVCRYFGGIKLGVRGLIDAYGAAADQVVAAAAVVEQQPLVTLRLTAPYRAFDTLRHRLLALGGTLGACEFADGVRCTVNVPRAQAAAFCQEARALGVRSEPL
jgi:uncharacterized YigZ family protein